ncbi:MAG TPA: ferrochelatase [Myxococcaceae bacterium]|nr:ferrochelatase [Myxococcaceae bacterium]
MGPQPQGLLLVNLGTPDAPRTREVRAYLREFLSDPRVIDIPAVGRWLLLNLVILPFRPAKSAEAYRKVWTEAGSPLAVYTADLARAVQDRLGQAVAVEWGMRYGKPSIRDAVTRLRDRGVSSVTVLPLYPQYASSSGGSTLEAVYAELGRQWNVMPVRAIGAFYDDPGFLRAFTEVIAPSLKESPPEQVLFSFHGLPERQIRKSDLTGAHCLSSERCCDAIIPANRNCYRAQCFFTARALAERLRLPPSGFSVAFQSRLGRTPWIRPYTDEVIPELARKGIKRLAVVCPSFVADCLETLEEIGIRAKESFREAGGEVLTLVPSLNAHPAWVEAVASWVQPAPTAPPF